MKKLQLKKEIVQDLTVNPRHVQLILYPVL